MRYPVRSACTGSTCAARRAGSHAATSVAATSVTSTAEIVIGSNPDVWNRNALRSAVVYAAPASPMTRPMARGRSASNVRPRTT